MIERALIKFTEEMQCREPICKKQNCKMWKNYNLLCIAFFIIAIKEVLNDL